MGCYVRGVAPQTSFVFFIPKRLSQASPPKYQLNICKQDHNIWTGIMLFCREVECLMQPFCCYPREQYTSKRNYEITVVILWKRLIFPD